MRLSFALSPSSSPSSASSTYNSAGGVALFLSLFTIFKPVVCDYHDVSAVQNLDSLYQQQPLLPPISLGPPNTNAEASEHIFTLRHLFHHGAYLYPNLHRRKDVLNKDATIWLKSEGGQPPERADPLIAYGRSERIHRLADRRPIVVDPMVVAVRQGEIVPLSPSAWSLDDVSGPNVTDKLTILSLAQMSADAYVEEEHTGDWEDVSNGFNKTLDFGWEGDGLRGHVFVDESNSTIVISVKGTSVAVYDGIDTTTNDKENDNLFFSCCCGQQGSITHRKVCDCATSTYSCNETCVSTSLKKENRYYAAARHLYSNVTELYPDANVWLTGHSLGGAVSSFLGLTYGVPTVTFESPPDALAAGRLGLPVPPGSISAAPQTRKYTGAHHFGHTADPLFLGTCTGASSLCSFAGYAMESSCHTGLECVYDVVADKGWRVGLGTHKIKSVIKDVIKAYDTVPKCVKTEDCVDCPLWKRYNSNSSETTTTQSTSTSRSRTRTATCQTPGWWGCLDESTTTGATTTRPITTTSTTSTCRTPGWFGCRDEVTTTKHHSTIPTATTTATSTCKTPGWFGACLDSTSTGPTSTHTSVSKSVPPVITPAPSMPTISIPTPTTISSTSCTSKQWFGLICVDPSPVPGKKHPKHEKDKAAFVNKYPEI